MQRPLNIAIHAGFDRRGPVGGIESFVIGLVTALARLPDQNERYHILVNGSDPDWITPYLGENQFAVPRHFDSPAPPVVAPSKPSLLERARAKLLRQLDGRISKIAHAEVEAAHQPHRQWPEVPLSNGFIEGMRCDLVHFTYQAFELCALPAIFTPHDLQHLHFPEFFTPKEIAFRETIYPAGVRLSQAVTVGSDWIKKDLIRQYGTGADKIFVIPTGPPWHALPAVTSDLCQTVRSKYGLPERFAYYPAVTWPHKNHSRLLEALALLRDRDGIEVNLVFSGAQTDYFTSLQSIIEECRLSEQVLFLGKVPEHEIPALYKMSEFAVIPTLHEAASFPIFEAWSEGVAVACSNVTSLPEQAADAALIFDPLDVDAIASALKTLGADKALRMKLIDKGRRRLLDFSWDRTASAYRALYRKVGRRILSAEEQCLLETNWMKKTKLECSV